VDERDARVTKALAEVHFVLTLLGPHEGTVSVATADMLAAEIRRLRSQQERILVMIHSWRDVAREQRERACEWRGMGESFAWHAIRIESIAEVIETQAKLLESIITT
jgi:hypothetical protein